MHCTTTCERIHRLQWGIIQTQKNSTVGKPGSDGTDGGNAEGIKDPIPANGISSLPYIINAYKTYLRENINNRFNRYSLLQFLEQINSSNEIRSLYDTNALIDEFQGVEMQFHKLNKEIDFSLFYNSLLDRISEFAGSQNNGPNSIENKKVLNYLYTAILGRIENLKENSEQNLIINTRDYLDMVEDNTKILKDIQMINIKEKVVDKYKDSYKSGIDMKIKEAESLIKEKIGPEIDNITTEIDNEVNTLIEETIALEKKAEKDLQELEEEKKKLGNSLAIKGMFNCFKIIGGVVSFLGPAGAIAGTVISVTSNVGEALALQNEQKVLNLPSDTVSSLNTLSNQIKMMRNQKITYLNKVLNDLSDEVERNPEELGDMRDKISDIRNKLQKVSKNELDFQQVSILESELNEEIETKADYLKLHSNDEKSVDALKAIQKVNQMVQFGSLFFNMYGEMRNDQEKMDIISDAMVKKEDEIKKLREYEENIYEIIAPMLQEMEDHMKDISEKLESESQVALDVTKWQVQSTLKDMKLQMQRLTEGYDVRDDLSRSIEKLDDVMSTLINLYDRIQSYQDQENLANYIADVSSVEASEINIEDQQLINAVNHLEFVIRSNIVLEQYMSAMDAFQQWVFPFADYYIENSMLPSQLELDKNIEILVQNTVKRIEAMKHKIDLYHVSIMNGDQYIVCEEFSSQYVSSKPFFVWKNEDFGYLISNLLSGREVILKADVEYSEPYKDAVKFSEINFNFKIKNETAQSLLSNTLKGFDITATHLGNSYYRYNNKISMITSNSVAIYYSYEINGDGIPIRKSPVYDKLKKGDLLLSPYTLWEVRLTNYTDQYSFQDLEKFKNEIDVELSGLGCYVNRNPVRFSENKSNSILPLFKPKDTGLNDCKTSKYRSARSVNGIAVDGDYMTNVASKVMSSPINLLCNFFKTYFVSNLVISINQVFYREHASESNYHSELPEEYNETRSNGSSGMTPTINDTDAISSENDCINGRFVQKYIIFDVNFNDNNSCSKSFLLGDQKSRSDNKLTQVPDLNSSLLLADMVTRTIKGNRYKSPIDKYLLSPRELISRKINDGVVRNERDVKQILQRLLSEKEERPSSLFSKLSSYAKSMLQVLGLVGNSKTREYVEDIRHLFA
ncbi:unnamed protein product [Larinioides sclopetarius]|uniref:Uncharacterized protein n=1 Tax=Larinioides sclopetarius TaxID=280406 RepID=A0AAV2B311_9ARAC